MERSFEVSITREDGVVAQPERTTFSEVSPAKSSPAILEVRRKVAVLVGKAAAVMKERNEDMVRMAQRASDEVAGFAFAAIYRRLAMIFGVSPFAVAK